MDYITYIAIQETVINNRIEISFQNQQAQLEIPQIQYDLDEKNILEKYSQILYDHLQGYQVRNLCYLFIYNPIALQIKRRHQIVTNLAVDLILKLTNLHFVPIILSELTPEKPLVIRDSSVIEKFIDISSHKDHTEFVNAYQTFKDLYRIQILDYETLAEIKASKQISYIYMPTIELIKLKTNIVVSELPLYVFKQSRETTR